MWHSTTTPANSWAEIAKPITRAYPGSRDEVGDASGGVVAEGSIRADHVDGASRDPKREACQDLRFPHLLRDDFFRKDLGVFAGVGGRLHPEQFRVAAIQAHELLMGALLDQAAMLEEDDAVRAPHRRKSV